MRRSDRAFAYRSLYYVVVSNCDGYRCRRSAGVRVDHVLNRQVQVLVKCVVVRLGVDLKVDVLVTDLCASVRDTRICNCSDGSCLDEEVFRYVDLADFVAALLHDVRFEHAGQRRRSVFNRHGQVPRKLRLGVFARGNLARYRGAQIEVLAFARGYLARYRAAQVEVCANARACLLIELLCKAGCVVACRQLA